MSNYVLLFSYKKKAHKSQEEGMISHHHLDKIVNPWLNLRTNQPTNSNRLFCWCLGSDLAHNTTNVRPRNVRECLNKFIPFPFFLYFFFFVFRSFFFFSFRFVIARYIRLYLCIYGTENDFNLSKVVNLMISFFFCFFFSIEQPYCKLMHTWYDVTELLINDE